MSERKEESLSPSEQQQIALTYRAMLAEVQQLSQKSAELDAERGEHSPVINAIKDLDPDRRCFRLIGGVLVERTIKEVLPAVQRNNEKISEVIESLSDSLQTKQKAVNEFQAKYNLNVQASKSGSGSSETSADAKPTASAGSGSGVLV